MDGDVTTQLLSRTTPHKRGRSTDSTLFVKDLALRGSWVGIADLIENLVPVTALRVVDARIFFGIKFVRSVLLVGAVRELVLLKLVLAFSHRAIPPGERFSDGLTLGALLQERCIFVNFSGFSFVEGQGRGSSRASDEPSLGWDCAVHEPTSVLSAGSCDRHADEPWFCT